MTGKGRGIAGILRPEPAIGIESYAVAKYE